MRRGSEVVDQAPWEGARIRGVSIVRDVWVHTETLRMVEDEFLVLMRETQNMA